jgi:hypothetical protein
MRGHAASLSQNLNILVGVADTVRVFLCSPSCEKAGQQDVIVVWPFGTVVASHVIQDRGDDADRSRCGSQRNRQVGLRAY